MVNYAEFEIVFLWFNGWKNSATGIFKASSMVVFLELLSTSACSWYSNHLMCFYFGKSVGIIIKVGFRSLEFRQLEEAIQ